MYMSPKLHKSRLSLSCILSVIAWVVGMIAIFISLTLLVFRHWPALASRTTCLSSQAVNFMSRIGIIEIVFIVALATFTACLLILAAILMKHKSNIVSYWHHSPRFRTLYPILISLALLSGIVALIIAIKMHVTISQLNNSYNNGEIPQTCLNSTEITNLVNKITPLIIILVLIVLMIFFTGLMFLCLPYRYCSGEKEGEYGPILAVKKKDRQPKLKVNKLEISQQELLASPVICEKVFQSIGVGDQPAIVKVEKKVERKFKSIGVGDEELKIQNDYGLVLAKEQPKKVETVDAAVNSIRIELKNSKVGNHTEYSSVQTDCEGLTEPIEYKNKSIEVQNFVQFNQAQEVATEKIEEEPTQNALLTALTPSRFRRNQERTETKSVDPSLLTPRRAMRVQEIVIEENESPEQDGYYYLNSARNVSEHISEPRSTRKLENINDSARKLVEDPLRASRGPSGINWSHYNILWAGERLNHIYTPPKPSRDLESSSNKKYKGSSKKWWPSNRNKKI